MSNYIKKTWADGETITPEALNNIEIGIAEAKKKAEQAEINANKKTSAHEEKQDNPHKVTAEQVGALPIEESTLKAGDVVDVTMSTAGILTASGAEVQFFVPLSKPVVGSPKVTATALYGFILRQNGKYTHGTSASDRAFPDTMIASYVKDTGVRISAKFTDTTNAINNAAIAIFLTAQITFS